MEKSPIRFAIENRLEPGQPEGGASQVWDDLLHYFFTLDDGYSTGPEIRTSTGVMDGFSAHSVQNTRSAGKIFIIIECKAPDLEGQDEV